jgi:7,8-dihydropterin-6-yl-methyl-4-(beta-D-ribofuranosyl)aminobenzene 5'-phosphate synthase
MKAASSTLRITTLVENSVHARGLRAEHGLAFHLQAGEQSVLFDTGPGDLILENARRLNIPLNHLDAVVLSHGHYDHTGGIAGVLAMSPKAKVFLHPAALQSRYVRETNGGFRSLGLTASSREALKKAQIVQTSGMMEISPGLFVTGHIPRETAYEDVGGAFFLDESCTKPDPILDDQALFFESQAGVVDRFSWAMFLLFRGHERRV